MSPSKRAVEPAPPPITEPIVVEVLGHVIVVKHDQPLDGETAWHVAYAYREEKVARELAEKDLRIKRAQITRLQDDQDAKRKAYGKRDVIERLFALWQELANHQRSLLGPERFDPARARLEQGYTEEQLTFAVAGIALNPYVSENGERQDEFEICVRSGKQVEKYARRCPPAKRKEIRAQFSAEKDDGQMALG